MPAENEKLQCWLQGYANTPTDIQCPTVHCMHCGSVRSPAFQSLSSYAVAYLPASLLLCPAHPLSVHWWAQFAMDVP